MDSIFCKKCLHGNSAYLQYCSNCNADLLSQTDEDPFSPIDGEATPQPKPEMSDEALERRGKIAIALSFVTTIFKVWVLYEMETSAHRSSPSISSILFVVSPIIVAAISASKSKRWYRVLFADSFLMILVILYVAVAISGKGGATSNVSSSPGVKVGAANTVAANTVLAETKSRDTSPVTIAISDLLKESEAGSAVTMGQKYRNRHMTVTGGVLYEFKATSVKVGKGQNPKSGKNPGAQEYFVSCIGKFNNKQLEIESTLTDVNRELGKAEPVTVNGVFEEASSNNNKHWVMLNGCSMVYTRWASKNGN